MLTTAGLAGVLITLPAGSAWADATPSAGPSASASPVASASPTPTASPTATATASPDTTASPDVSQAPTGTTDCGQVQGGTGTPGLAPGVVCQAGGLNPGATSGSGVPTLPRTGPAPLLPTLALGSWLLLLGVLATAAGRRRTART